MEGTHSQACTSAERYSHSDPSLLFIGSSVAAESHTLHCRPHADRFCLPMHGRRRDMATGPLSYTRRLEERYKDERPRLSVNGGEAAARDRELNKAPDREQSPRTERCARSRFPCHQPLCSNCYLSIRTTPQPRSYPNPTRNALTTGYGFKPTLRCPLRKASCDLQLIPGSRPPRPSSGSPSTFSSTTVFILSFAHYRE